MCWFVSDMAFHNTVHVFSVQQLEYKCEGVSHCAKAGQFSGFRSGFILLVYQHLKVIFTIK